MTWMEWAIDQLVNNGMFEDQAKAVMAEVVEHPATVSMKDRWNDSVDGYPPQMKAVCLVAIKTQALEWIDRNCPKAWFRPMFVLESATTPPEAATPATEDAVATPATEDAADAAPATNHG